MTRFPGFPATPQYVPIPKVFYSDVLPQITDTAELLVTLHLFRLLAATRGYPPAIPQHLLTDDPLLAAGFTALGRDPRGEAVRGLALTAERGVCLQAVPPVGEARLLLNTAGGQRAAAAIRRGDIALAESPAAVRQSPVVAKSVAPTDIATLYEENIGMLSPIIAEQLVELERDYPPAWVREAFRIAVEANKRNLRYIETILQRWKAEGKDDGKPARNPGAARRATDYSDWLPARPTQR